jgi:hypothetical protein
MIIIKLIFVGAALLVSVPMLKAQEIFIEAGKISSNFNYTNSEGDKLSNLNGISDFVMSIGYAHNLFTEKLECYTGATYCGYGSIGSIALLNDYLEWKADYLEWDLGIQYTYAKLCNLSFYIKGQVSLGFLLQGTQTVNNTVYNLKELDDYANSMFDYKGGIGIKGAINNNTSFYLQCLLGSGSDIENGEGETLNIISHSICIGLKLDIGSSQEKAKYTKRNKHVDRNGLHL